MTWEIFLGISALVGFAVAIMTPIVKLTGAVTKLSCAIDSLSKRFDENQKATDKRLDAHGKKIDELDIRLAQSERAYEHIKEKVDYFHK